MHVEQKGCNQVNVVYDYGDSGKSARVMIFNGRPVFYADTLEVSYFETYEITKDRIKAYSVEADRKNNIETHSKSEIYLDDKKNWIEEFGVYLINHEAEVKHYKLIYKRLN
jgi:hypothetical protein